MEKQVKPLEYEVLATSHQGKQYLTKKDVLTAVAVGVGFSPAFANAAFTLDTSEILTAIGVVVAAVATVALASIMIPLTIKGIKYLRGAF